MPFFGAAYISYKINTLNFYVSKNYGIYKYLQLQGSGVELPKLNEENEFLTNPVQCLQQQCKQCLQVSIKKKGNSQWENVSLCDFNEILHSYSF